VASPTRLSRFSGNPNPLTDLPSTILHPHPLGHHPSPRLSCTRPLPSRHPRRVHIWLLCSHPDTSSQISRCPMCLFSQKKMLHYEMQTYHPWAMGRCPAPDRVRRVGRGKGASRPVEQCPARRCSVAKWVANSGESGGERVPCQGMPCVVVPRSVVKQGVRRCRTKELGLPRQSRAVRCGEMSGIGRGQALLGPARSRPILSRGVDSGIGWVSRGEASPRQVKSSSAQSSRVESYGVAWRGAMW
jgi:hypothetical protein